ncbi:PREDICTED: EPIDERMAL PATTERNING FACTOR-like protein 1 [Camelina sativa]|uniref:Epidermal patterning factor-like protein n=1 Tax=Camelina sativa TaxID=90675 RepID=A0ABM0V9R6_CAMSA|nr:PREDICTED: EPIDERMAL PATTERNING FACTOR-like protein 1 [Camelina sativa]
MFAIFKTSSLLILLLFVLLITLQVSSFLQPVQPPDSPQVALIEDKARLGSTPPSCHNRCNNCHPCMAVQVPTLPTRSRFTRVNPFSGGFVRPPPSSLTTVLDQYSNYKPMGWKCHCNGHFYNP